MTDSLKTKKDADLIKELKQKREMLRKFRFGASGSKVKDVKAGKNLKKDIARILTETKARELSKEE